MSHRTPVRFVSKESGVDRDAFRHRSLHTGDTSHQAEDVIAWLERRDVRTGGDDGPRYVQAEYSRKCLLRVRGLSCSHLCVQRIHPAGKNSREHLTARRLCDVGTSLDAERPARDVDDIGFHRASFEVFAMIALHQ